MITRRSLLRNALAGAIGACAMGVRFPQAAVAGDWVEHLPLTREQLVLAGNQLGKTHATFRMTMSATRTNNGPVWIECED